MRRSVLALLIASAAAAAPGPNDESPPDLYFPVQVGAKRVMTSNSKSGPGDYTDVVTKVEEKGGKYTVTVEREGRKPKFETVYEVSKAGLFRTAPAVGAGALLKLPHKEGATWTQDGVVPPGSGLAPPKGTYTVGKAEEVDVPAGTYKAIRVDLKAVSGGVTRETTFWYAAGVGLVKSVAPGDTQVLKAFSPGRAEKK